MQRPGAARARGEPAADPILEDFERLRRRAGSAPLVASPTRRMTVDEVDALARRYALRLPPLPAGTMVGQATANGPAFLAAYLALRRARLTPLLLDAATPDSVRQTTAAKLGAAGVLSSADGWAEAPDWAATGTGAAGAGREAWCRLSAGTGAVKLTSGSTGDPRGIVVPAEALAADDDQLAASMGLLAQDRLLAFVALSHSYGFSSLALPALRRGCLLVLPDGRGPLDVLAAARAADATFFPSVPVWLDALTRLSSPPAWPGSLRLVISAGAPLPAATAERFRSATGMDIHVFYGASECGGITYDREGGAARRGTVGEPVAGVTVELDADGRAVVTSRAVAFGYLPDQEASRLHGRFTTGDLAAWEGRELSLRGRADDLIIVKGKNVHPREVEAALREIEGVEDAVVLGVSGAGGVGQSVKAVIACRPGALDYETVIARCRARLDEHKVPRSVVFVAALPRTARGKLDRLALQTLS